MDNQKEKPSKLLEIVNALDISSSFGVWYMQSSDQNLPQFLALYASFDLVFLSGV